MKRTKYYTYTKATKEKKYPPPENNTQFKTTKTKHLKQNVERCWSDVWVQDLDIWVFEVHVVRTFLISTIFL